MNGKEIELGYVLRPEAHVRSILWFLRAVNIGINPHAPTEAEIRKALVPLGGFSRMELKNHCALLIQAGFPTVRKKSKQLSNEDIELRKLIDRVWTVL